MSMSWLHHWLHPMRIKRKLTLIMIGVMALSFGVSALIAGVYRYRSDRNGVEHHLSVLASAIGANCSAALVFDDEAAASRCASFSRHALSPISRRFGIIPSNVGAQAKPKSTSGSSKPPSNRWRTIPGAVKHATTCGPAIADIRSAHTSCFFA